jgi:hypothetical protein
MTAEPHRTPTPLAAALLRLLRERPTHPYRMHQPIRDRGSNHAIKVRAGSLCHTVPRPHAIALEAERPENVPVAPTPIRAARPRAGRRRTSIDKEFTR